MDRCSDCTFREEQSCADVCWCRKASRGAVIVLRLAAALRTLRRCLFMAETASHRPAHPALSLLLSTPHSGFGSILPLRTQDPVVVLHCGFCLVLENKIMAVGTALKPFVCVFLILHLSFLLRLEKRIKTKGFKGFYQAGDQGFAHNYVHFVIIKLTFN